MKRWFWQQSSGAVRSLVLLGLTGLVTIGGLYFTPPLTSLIVTSSHDPESHPHSHSVSPALAALPPGGDTLEDPLLSPEQQTDLLARYHDTLRAIPGVYGVAIETGDTLVVDVFVHTDPNGLKPAMLPEPLRAIPPFLEAVPVKLQPFYILPPPAGVVVVAMDGTTSIQSDCPAQYEMAPMFDWTFCLPPQYAGIPPSGIMLPPIAGIPRVEAANAVERNRHKLMKLPGVQSVWLSDEGVIIYAKDPRVLPSDIEGVPVIPQVVNSQEE